MWLLPSQTEGKDVFEQRGWTVFIGDDIPVSLLKQEA